MQVQAPSCISKRSKNKPWKFGGGGGEVTLRKEGKESGRRASQIKGAGGGFFGNISYPGKEGVRGKKRGRA